MLNRLADLVRLRTYANTLVQPAGRVTFDALRELSLGDQVRGHIEATLPDGTVRVAIKNQTFVLRLPFSAQAGDVLQLHVTAREPRLRFVAAAPVESPSSPTSLSETARFVTALLDETDKLPMTTVAPAGKPLLATPPDNHDEITAGLRHALSTSGMFYEAHQAQWAAGQRPLALLLEEPQAQLMPLHDAQPSMPPDGIDEGAVGAADAGPHLPELPVHRDALNIVRHQLVTLDTQQVVWNGLIWRDQPVQWEVAAPDPETPDDVPEDQPWRSRLRLTLPRLGAIDATLDIARSGVTITLHAANAEAAATLTEHQAELRLALRGAGLTPAGITICCDETA